jgi:hypothetical protein
VKLTIFSEEVSTICVFGNAKEFIYSKSLGDKLNSNGNLEYLVINIRCNEKEFS